MPADTELQDRGDSFTPTLETPAAASAEPQDPPKVEPEGEVAPKTDDDEASRDDKGRFTGKGIIPIERHNAVLQREREQREATERQLQELQGQLAQVNRNADVGKLEERLVELRREDRKALLAGDEEKSVEIAAEMDRLNRQIILQQSNDMSSRAREEALETIRVETAIESLEKLYPQLNAEDEENYDQELTDIVLAEQNRLITQMRMSPSQALTKAASTIMKRFAAAQPDPKADTKGLGAARDANRKATQTSKNIEAALKTPPNLSDVGRDTDSVGMKDGLPTPMNVEDLAALPEATLKRMRGDTF